VYARLVGIELAGSVDARTHDVMFTGWQSIKSQLPYFLRLAMDAGVRHAIVAVDNDGGARRHPGHEASHDAVAHAKDPDGCRVCAMTTWVPPDWNGDVVLAVPVQTIETWLLVLKDPAFESHRPEGRFHKRVLKRDLFGDVASPAARSQLAFELLSRQDARDVLMRRPSYRHFAEQLARWRGSP
jgi:hypothetical protein